MGYVTFTSGANEASLPLGGSTVGAARERLADALNIDGSAKATVNGRLVEESFVLADGDQVTFTKATGEKG